MPGLARAGESRDIVLDLMANRLTARRYARPRENPLCCYEERICDRTRAYVASCKALCETIKLFELRDQERNER